MTEYRHRYGRKLFVEFHAMIVQARTLDKQKGISKREFKNIKTA